MDGIPVGRRCPLTHEVEQLAQLDLRLVLAHHRIQDDHIIFKELEHLATKVMSELGMSCETTRVRVGASRPSNLVCRSMRPRLLREPTVGAHSNCEEVMGLLCVWATGLHSFDFLVSC